jgi:hypothetical protein
MDAAEAIAVWSVRASGVALAVAALLALRAPRRFASARRAVWTLGAALLVVHEVAALWGYFDWSQAAAWRHVATVTERATGIDWGGGLVFNYAAAVVWVLDAAWWLRRSQSYEKRPCWIDAAVWAYLAAMFFFGAVAFGEGWTQVAGAAAFLAVGAFALVDHPADDAPAA